MSRKKYPFGICLMSVSLFNSFLGSISALFHYIVRPDEILLNEQTPLTTIILYYSLKTYKCNYNMENIFCFDLTTFDIKNVNT